MRIPNTCLYSLLVLALAASPALAQEEEGGFGLDLSTETTTEEGQEEQPAPEGEEAPPENTGLDVSGSAGDLRPRVVLLGLDTPDRAGAAQAKRWLRWLQGVVQRSRQVAVVANAAQARQQLEGGYAEALRCEEASCFSEPASTLDVDLLVTARLALEDDGWTLRLFTYDNDRREVEVDVVTGRSPKDSRFILKSGTTLEERLKTAARPRSLLRVSSNVPQAVVRVGDRVLGVGNVDARMPPGEVRLIVEANDYEPFTQQVTLEPGQTQQIQARLELSGPAPEGPSEEAAPRVSTRTPASGPTSSATASAGGPSLFSRPPLYTALVGLAAVGAGFWLGQQSQGISSRITDADGDGVLDLTRSEYLAARQQSALGTGLIAGGGALAGGSLLWLLIVPARSEPAPSVASTSGGTTVHFVLGGSF
jgi:hypothetical protein